MPEFVWIVSLLLIDPTLYVYGQEPPVSADLEPGERPRIGEAVHGSLVDIESASYVLVQA